MCSNKIKKLLDIYISKKYNDLLSAAKKVKFYSNDYIEDILHENLLYLYELSDEKLEKMLKEDSLHLYVSRCVKLSAVSESSKYQSKNQFFKKHLLSDMKGYSNIPDEEFNEENQEKLLAKIMGFINKLHWYDKALYLQNLKGDSAKAISQKTGISALEIGTNLNMTRKKVNQFINENKLKLNVN